MSLLALNIFILKENGNKGVENIKKITQIIDFI
jgi:hypothetical protein